MTDSVSRRAGPFTRRGRLLVTLLYTVMTAQAVWHLTHHPTRVAVVSSFLILLAAPAMLYLLWFRRVPRQDQR